MSDARRPLTLVELVRQPQIGDVIIDHAYRGARVQRLLRLVLVVFLAAVLVFEPPIEGRALCWVIVALYGIWSVVIGVVVKVGGRRMLRYVWLAVLVDVVAIAAVTLVAADTDPLSWTAYLLINGLFLLPVIAATQLSPWVCGVAVGPAVVVYLVASLITREVEIEPISSPILRTVLLAGVGVGCVLLSRLQRSRVLTIGQLAGDRAALVGELLTVEEREQRDLAEALHDGALQYVLAARQDLEDVRDDPGRSESWDRIDFALAESSRLLRSTMAQLHPAVVESAGLAAALRDVATTAEGRGDLVVDLDVDRWPATTRTSADALLLNTARELITNVVKHAEADRAAVSLTLDGQTARLRVSDNGKGMAGVDLDRQLAAKHLGLASHRIRRRGGRRASPVPDGQPHGTVVEVDLPAIPQPAPV